MASPPMKLRPNMAFNRTPRVRVCFYPNACGRAPVNLSHTLLCVCFAMVGGCSAVPPDTAAPPPRLNAPAVESPQAWKLRVLSVGTYSVEVADKAAKRLTLEEEKLDFHYVRSATLLNSSTEIPLLPETRFGVMYVLDGSRKGARYPCRVVWRYPFPGVLDSTGQRVLSSEWNGYAFVDWVDVKGLYVRKDDEEWPEGQYTLEVFIGSQLAIQQSFELKRPSVTDAKESMRRSLSP